MNLHLNFSATLDGLRAMAARDGGGPVALLPNLLVAIALFVAIAAAASLLKRAVRH